MAVTKQTLSDALADIERAAPGLRAAGVLRVSVDGVFAELAPVVPLAPREEQPPPSEVEMGDLDAFRREDKP